MNAVVGRDQRRRPQRHPRAAGAARGRARRHARPPPADPSPKASVGAGTGTRCLRMEGRHRHGLARAARRATAGTRWASWCRATSAACSPWTACPWAARSAATRSVPTSPAPPAGGRQAGGSCMIVVATDAPLIAARPRAPGRPRPSSAWPARGPPTTTAAATTRSPSRPPPRPHRHGRPRRARTLLPSDAVSPLFQAVLEATEEAVYNSLLRATSVTSALGSAEALPIGRVTDVMRRYGRPASF